MNKKVDWNTVLNDSLKLAPSIFGFGIDISALIKAFKGKSPDIQAKAEQAASALHEASVIVTELQESIESEIEKVSTLKNEYEKYENLVSISKGQSKALLQQLEHYQSQGRGRERWIALLVNVAAGIVVFILGILVSPYIKSFIE